jgi:hypothetical protein
LPQLGSGSGRPTQVSQGPQSFWQARTGVQGRLVSREMKAPLPAGSWQQPKQSQPFGVSGPQLSRHPWGWVSRSSLHVALEPGTLAFSS